LEVPYSEDFSSYKEHKSSLYREVPVFSKKNAYIANALFLSVMMDFEKLEITIFHLHILLKYILENSRI
jgi:hypothetical protein